MAKEQSIKAEVMTKNVVQAFRMLKNVRHNGFDYQEGKVFESIPPAFLEEGFAEIEEVKEGAEFDKPLDRSDILAADREAKKEAKKARFESAKPTKKVEEDEETE